MTTITDIMSHEFMSERLVPPELDPSDLDELELVDLWSLMAPTEEISHGENLSESSGINGSWFGIDHDLFDFISGSGSNSAIDFLNLYLQPTIIAVGLVGNTLSLAVFSFTHLQRLSSSLYLSLLSIADIVFLLALFVIWLDRVGGSLFSREGWCQSVLYASHVSVFLAAWSVVSFTAERYITVYHPLHKDSFCTKKKARLIAATLTLFALVFYTFVTWTHDVVRFGPLALCGPLPRFHFVITAMTSLDTICSCLVPSVVIIILNVRIIRKIHRYQNQTFDTGPTHLLTVTTGTAAAIDALRRRSLVQTSVSASGSMHIKFSSAAAAGAAGAKSRQRIVMLPIGSQPHNPAAVAINNRGIHHDDVNNRRHQHGDFNNHGPIHVDISNREGPHGDLNNRGGPHGDLNNRGGPHEDLNNRGIPHVDLNNREPPHGDLNNRGPPHGDLNNRGGPHGDLNSSRLPHGDLNHRGGPRGDRLKRIIRGQSQYRTARMLLILSSVTVLLNLPFNLFRVQALFQGLVGGSERGPKGVKWQETFQFFHFLNFAVNFFVYSACGRQFRTGLTRLGVRIRLNMRRCLMAAYCIMCRRDGKLAQSDGYNV